MTIIKIISKKLTPLDRSLWTSSEDHVRRPLWISPADQSWPASCRGSVSLAIPRRKRRAHVRWHNCWCLSNLRFQRYTRHWQGRAHCSCRGWLLLEKEVRRYKTSVILDMGWFMWSKDPLLGRILTGYAIIVTGKEEEFRVVQNWNIVIVDGVPCRARWLLIDGINLDLSWAFEDWQCECKQAGNANVPQHG